MCNYLKKENHIVTYCYLTHCRMFLSSWNNDARYGLIPEMGRFRSNEISG